MLAMALLLHGALLGGMGSEAGGADGSGEGVWTLASPPEGFNQPTNLALFGEFVRAMQGPGFATPFSLGLPAFHDCCKHRTLRIACCACAS